MRSVQKGGYAWAVTTIAGINTPRTNPYLLHRFGIDIEDHWLILALRLSGISNLLKKSARFLVDRRSDPEASANGDLATERYVDE